jgi:arginine decarboxylase
MKELTQKDAPLYEALEKLRRSRVVPFDVPGHKRGRGNPELVEFLGEKCVGIDVNSMKPLDNLSHPTSVIKDAETLAAEAFGADYAYFMIGGTTSSVQSMILYSCQMGDKIILPRNVHKSVINTLVLCGAIPIYINPRIDPQLGIALGMQREDIQAAIEANPDAKAVLVNNPTYYGICSNIGKIVELAHAQDMLVLVDEAHGTHLYFGEDFPSTAMAAGADISSVSMHKSGGSLTQSSLLLAKDTIDDGYMRQIINLTQTTSASYLLLASLDLSRRNLALHGKELFANVRKLAAYAREEIALLDGYYAFGEELINDDSIFAFDDTKLAIFTLDIGLAGIEVYDILRDEYNIQVEFGDLANILAYISVGDRLRDIERLVNALSEIKRRFGQKRSGLMVQEYIDPQVIVSPQQAFYAPKVSLPIDQVIGHVSSEFVMTYPPGIPILAPGEKITKKIVSYINYCKEKGCLITGTSDLEVTHLNVLKGEADGTMV